MSLISWLQSSYVVILEPKKIVCHCFHCFPIYLPGSDGTWCHDLSCWFFFFFFNWRIIALQNFIFCQTSTWISHRYTSSPSHPSRFIQNSCLSFLSHTANSHWLSVYFTYDNVSFCVTLSIYLTLSTPLAMILLFWMLSFKPAFSLSSMTFIKRLFSFSSCPKDHVICISEVIDISPSNLDYSLCFILPGISVSTLHVS